MRLPFENTDGITVRELRKVLSGMSDTDENGNEITVYVTAGNLHSSTLRTAFRDEDGDLVLVPDFWQSAMEDLGTWSDYRNG